MPLLGKKVFQLAKPLPNLQTAERIYVIKHTGERFQSKEEFEKRLQLYNDNVWTCQCTGHINLTHEEAWKSEQEKLKMLKKDFPEFLEKPVLEIVHHNTASLESLLDQTYVKIHSLYFPGELVQFKIPTGTHMIKACIVSVDVPKEVNCHSPCSDKENSEGSQTFNKDSPNKKHPPKLLPFKCNVKLLDEDKIISSIPSSDLTRCDRLPNKELLRLFIRAHAVRHGTNLNSPWVVEAELVKKYSLQSRFADFLISPIKMTESTDKKPRKRKLSEKGNILDKKTKLDIKPISAQNTLHIYSKTPKTTCLTNAQIVNGEHSPKDLIQGNIALDSLAKCVVSLEDCNVTLTSQCNDNYNTPLKKVLKENGKPSEKSPRKQSSNSASKKTSGLNTSKSQKPKKKTPEFKKENVKNKSISNKKKVNAKEKTEQKSAKSPAKKTPQAGKQKLKQMTLLDMSSKKTPSQKVSKSVKKSPTKSEKTPKKSEKTPVKSNKTPNKTPNKALDKTPSKNLQKTPEKAKAALSKVTLTLKASPKSKYSFPPFVKRFAITVQQKKKAQYFYYLNKIFAKIKPEMYVHLPEEIREIVLKRVKAREEKQKMAEMTEEERINYVKNKQAESQRKRKELKLKNQSLTEQQAEVEKKPEEKPLKALPTPKLVSTPDDIPNELFGDVAMTVEFINSFGGLFMPQEPYPVQSDLLLRSLSNGKEGFGYLARILIILLQTLLQDQIAEEYKELGVKLSDIPVNIFTASEMARLCLRKNDELDKQNNPESGVDADDTEEVEDVAEEVVSQLETMEIYELDPSVKLQILSGLCHRIMNSYSVQQFMEDAQKTASKLWREKLEACKNQVKEKPDVSKKENKEQATEIKEEKLADTEAKSEPSEIENGSTNDKGNIGETQSNKNDGKKGLTLLHFYGNGGNSSENKEQESMPKEEEEDLASVVKRRRILSRKAQEEKEKQLQLEKERREKEAEDQRKLKMKEDFSKRFEKAIQTAKLSLRHTPLGFDRNFTRYWLFSGSTPGLYLEKGWVDNNISYQYNLAVNENPDEVADEDLLNSIKIIGENERIPSVGQNLWFCYENVKELDQLLKCLSRHIPEEKFLLLKLQKYYQDISRSIIAKKVPRVELKASDGEKELLEGIQKELKDIELRIKRGMLGGVPNYEEWELKLNAAKTCEEIANCLLETQGNVLTRYFQGIMKNKKIVHKTDDSSEEVEIQESPGKLKWQESVANCPTFSRMHVLLRILEGSITWEKSSQNAKCKICRRKDEDYLIISCDQCKETFHMLCLRPALTEFPEGEWLCPLCQPTSRRQRDIKNKYKESSEDDEEEESEEDEEDEEDDYVKEDNCCLCGGDEDIFNCTKCHSAFHTYCHEPQMRHKPRGNWVCSYCQSGKKNKSRKQKTSRRAVNRDNKKSHSSNEYRKQAQQVKQELQRNLERIKNQAAINQANFVKEISSRLKQKIENKVSTPDAELSSMARTSRALAHSDQRQRDIKNKYKESSEDEEEESEENEEENEEDDYVKEDHCCLCGGDEDIFHCTKCHSAFHTFCHEPQMRHKPCGNWVCSSCQSGKKNKSRKQKTNGRAVNRDNKKSHSSNEYRKQAQQVKQELQQNLERIKNEATINQANFVKEISSRLKQKIENKVSTPDAELSSMARSSRALARSAQRDEEDS